MNYSYPLQVFILYLGLNSVTNLHTVDFDLGLLSALCYCSTFYRFLLKRVVILLFNFILLSLTLLIYANFIPSALTPLINSKKSLTKLRRRHPPDISKAALRHADWLVLRSSQISFRGVELSLRSLSWGE